MHTYISHTQTVDTNISLIGRPNILLIEDDQCLQMIHSMYLQRARCNFQLVTTGADAISAFNANHFDLVLLDIQLPDMSGLDVNKAIRSSFYGKTVPVIALTSLGKSIEKECLAAGVNQVFDKPINYEHFLNVLQTTLRI